MENILMRFCREQHRYPPSAVAAKMKISIEEYMDIETGTTLLTSEQAKQLGKIYKVNPSYFSKEAEQLELLLLRTAIIKKWKPNSTIS